MFPLGTPNLSRCELIKGIEQMATYAIGDIQGCYDELMLLLEAIHFNEREDRLWVVGDLVNRGHYSLKVLRFLKQHEDRNIIVLGNHDLHLLAVAKGYQNLRPLDTFQDVLSASDREELIDWLRKIPLFHYDADLNFVMVHAGIYPRWTLQQTKSYATEVEKILCGDQVDEFLKVMYGNEPASWSDSLTGFDRARFIVNVLTRMRYYTQKGDLNLTEKGAPSRVSEGLLPWFSVRRQASLGANIVFGHWAAINGKTNIPSIYATDTGCAWGYKLTALRLEDQQIFQVPCEKPL